MNSKFSKNKKTEIAIILNGCGYLDGSDLQEVVFLMYHIKKQNADYILYSSNIDQKITHNHFNKNVIDSQRNIKVESARISNSKICDMANFDATKIDALIFPGGFGISKNLSDFNINGINSTINLQIANAISTMIELNKPIGLIGMSAFVLAKLIKGATIASGKGLSDLDEKVKSICWQMPCISGETITDSSRKLITCNGNLLEKVSILDISIEMEHLVEGLIDFINNTGKVNRK